MKAPQNLNVQPVLSNNPQVIAAKVNELIRKLDEVLRLLHSDIKIMDFRELPPHYSIDHASWKWYQNPTTGDLELWHRTDNTWAKTSWDVIGDLTRPTQPVIT